MDPPAYKSMRPCCAAATAYGVDALAAAAGRSRVYFCTALMLPFGLSTEFVSLVSTEATTEAGDGGKNSTMSKKDVVDAVKVRGETTERVESSWRFERLRLSMFMSYYLSTQIVERAADGKMLLCLPIRRCSMETSPNAVSFGRAPHLVDCSCALPRRTAAAAPIASPGRDLG